MHFWKKSSQVSPSEPSNVLRGSALPRLWEGLDVEWWSQSRAWPATVRRQADLGIQITWRNGSEPSELNAGTFGQLRWKDEEGLWGQVVQVVEETTDPPGIWVYPVSAPRIRAQQRRSERSNLAIKLLIRLMPDEEPLSVWTTDVSQGGCRFLSRVKHSLHSAVVIGWPLHGREVLMTGRVAWVSPSQKVRHEQLFWETGIAWQDLPKDVANLWKSMVEKNG